MVSIDSLKIEYKAGAVLGGTALILSSIVGMAAGNTVLYTFGRALFLGIVFAFLGTGLTLLLRKYVPELFEAFREGSFGDTAVPADGTPKEEPSTFSAGVSSFDASSPVTSTDVSSPDSSGGENTSEFVPLGDFAAGQKQYGDEHLDTAKGSRSTGKHLLEEKGMKYEPKIIAEAIRTMMSKDQ
jgi:hypothetical protein